MLDARFSYDGFLGAANREDLARELEQALTEILVAAAEPHTACYSLVDELRALGHDLWSFDESDDFQSWCADWVKPKGEYELIITFRFGEDEPRGVSAVFQRHRAVPKPEP